MSRRTRSLASEFVVVVIGVMVALAADSAVERRGERVAAEEALAAVRMDLANDVAQLDTFRLPWLENQKRARDDLGGWLESRRPIPDSVQFINSLRLIATYLTFDANTAAVESLRNAGRLDLLRDGDVRQALLTYLNTVEDVAEVDDLQRAAVLELQGRLMPQLVGQVAWSRVHDTRWAPGEMGDWPVEAREAAATGLDADGIRRDGSLDQLLIATEQPYRVQVTLYRRLRAQAEILDQLLKDHATGAR